jgi:hypothetical protein
MVVEFYEQRFPQILKLKTYPQINLVLQAEHRQAAVLPLLT